MNNTIKDLEKELQKTELATLLNSFLNVAVENKYPLAFYRLPQNNEIVAVVSFSKDEPMVSLGNTSDKSGFIVSPFLSDHNKVHFIASDLVIHLNSFKIFSSSGSHSEADTFIEKVLSFNPSVAQVSKPDAENLPAEENYMEVTSDAISRIKKEEFKKVVLARKKTLDFNLSPVELFLALNKVQKDSFISLVAIPEKNIWVGASPELLVSTDKNNIFRTVALAGTQKASCTEANAVWTQKEIEEQALVIRYIISCFKKIRIREYEEVGPKTVKSGNVFHLKTDFSVNLNEVQYPNLGHVMLELLHPTSAVCGTPKEEALKFIKSFEGLDRKFYSGYLGPVNIDQETHVFVNIRCAEIIDDKINLYSGAGITSESNPEKELQETELKMQLIENLLSNKGSE